MKINMDGFIIYPIGNQETYMIENWVLSADNEIFQVHVKKQLFYDDVNTGLIRHLNIEKVNSTRTDLWKHDVKRLGMKILDKIFTINNDTIIQHENKYYINDSWIHKNDFKEKLSELIVKKYQNKMKYLKNKMKGKK